MLFDKNKEEAGILEAKFTTAVGQAEHNKKVLDVAFKTFYPRMKSVLLSDKEVLFSFPYKTAKRRRQIIKRINQCQKRMMAVVHHPLYNRLGKKQDLDKVKKWVRTQTNFEIL